MTWTTLGPGGALPVYMVLVGVGWMLAVAAVATCVDIWVKLRKAESEEEEGEEDE